MKRMADSSEAIAYELSPDNGCIQIIPERTALSEGADI